MLTKWKECLYEIRPKNNCKRLESKNKNHVNSLPGVTCDLWVFPLQGLGRGSKCQQEFYEIYTSNVFQPEWLFNQFCCFPPNACQHIPKKKKHANADSLCKIGRLLAVLNFSLTRESSLVNGEYICTFKLFSLLKCSNFDKRTGQAEKKEGGGAILITKTHNFQTCSAQLRQQRFVIHIHETTTESLKIRNTPGWIWQHEVLAIMWTVNTTAVNLQESLRRLVCHTGSRSIIAQTHGGTEKTTGCYWVYVHSASREKQPTNYFSEGHASI